MIVVKIDEFKLLCFVEVEEDMAQHLLIEAVSYTAKRAAHAACVLRKH